MIPFGDALRTVRRRVSEPDGYALLTAVLTATAVLAISVRGPVHRYVDGEVPVPTDLAPGERPTVSYALGYVSEVHDGYVPTSATMVLLDLLVVATLVYAVLLLVGFVRSRLDVRTPSIPSPLPPQFEPTWRRVGATVGVVVASGLVVDTYSPVDNVYWGQVLVLRALGLDRETLVPLAVEQGDTALAALVVLVPLVSTLAMSYVAACAGLAVARRPVAGRRLADVRAWLAEPTGPRVLGSLLVGAWIAVTLSREYREDDDHVHAYFPEYTYSHSPPDPSLGLSFPSNLMLALDVLVVAVAVYLVGCVLAWLLADDADAATPARTTPLSPTWPRLVAVWLLVVVGADELPQDTLFGPLPHALSSLHLPVPLDHAALRWLHAQFAQRMGAEVARVHYQSGGWYYQLESGPVLWPYVPTFVVAYLVVAVPFAAARLAYDRLASRPDPDRQRDGGRGPSYRES